MPTKAKNGITSLLNEHYNTHAGNYTFDPESEHLHTVTVKLGERSDSLSAADYLAGLPRHKRKKLYSFLGSNITKQQAEEHLTTQFEALEKLDRWLEIYDQERKNLLAKVYQHQNEDRAQLEDITSKIKELVPDTADEDVFTVNTLHQYIRTLYQNPSSQLHKQFLSNLWSDVAGQYAGYLYKFQKAQTKFSASKASYAEFLEKTRKVLTLSQRYNPIKEKTSANQIYPTLWGLYQDRNKVNLENLNDSIAKLKKNLHELNQRLNGLKVTAPEVAELYAELEKLLSPTQSMRVSFNHERTFPSFKPAPTLSDLYNEVAKLIEQKYLDPKTGQVWDWYTRRLRELNKKSSTKFHPFRGRRFDKEGIEKEDKSASAQAREIWNQGGSIKVLLEEIRIRAENAAAECKEKFENQDNSSKDFHLLREIAGWLNVRVIAVGVPLKTKERQEFTHEVNLLTSRLQNLTGAYEAEFSTQAVFLTGMYRPFGEGCSYLVTNQSENKLRLLLDFGRPITTGPKAAKFLRYTKEGQPYEASEGDTTEYKHYNTPELFAQNYQAPAFEFALHFGKNQLRKYFWNQSRTQEGTGLAHHIFAPHSRLKLSSMRLFRKFNPVRKMWEYYLNLALYRLETSAVRPPAPAMSIGYDIGENSLLAATTTKLQSGQKTSYRPNLKHTRQEKYRDYIETHYAKELRERNYIPPVNRTRVRNKIRTVTAQTSALVAKEALRGRMNVLEDQYLANTKNKHTLAEPWVKIIKKMQYNLATRTRQKLISEFQMHEEKSFDERELLTFVDTTKTSKLCARCGHFSEDYTKHGKIKEFLNSNQQRLDLRSVTNKETNQNLLKPLPYLDQEYPEAFVFDLDNPKVDKFAERVAEYRQDPDPKKLKSLNTELIYTSRPGWYAFKKGEFNSETFRCLVCGFVTSCDEQAALTISRLRLYYLEKKASFTLSPKAASKVAGMTQNIQNLERIGKSEKAEGLKNKIATIQLEEFLKSVYRNQENDFEAWYQEKLLEHGYTDDGYAKWNIPKEEVE